MIIHFTLAVFMLTDKIKYRWHIKRQLSWGKIHLKGSFNYLEINYEVTV